MEPSGHLGPVMGLIYLLFTGCNEVNLLDPYARCRCPVRYGISVLDSFTASTREKVVNYRPTEHSCRKSSVIAGWCFSTPCWCVMNLETPVRC